MLLITLIRQHLMNRSLKKIFNFKTSVILQSIFILKKLLSQCTKAMCSRKALLRPIKKTRCLFNRHPTVEQLHPRVFCMFLQLISFRYQKLELERRQEVDHCYQHTKKTASCSREATPLRKRKTKRPKKPKKFIEKTFIVTA